MISGGGVTKTIPITQAGSTISYKYIIQPTTITATNVVGSRVKATIKMIEQRYLNGTMISSGEVAYSILTQNGSSPANPTTYENEWGGTWQLTQSEGTTIEVYTIKLGTNPSAGVTVKLIPGDTYKGQTVDLYIARTS